MKPNVLWLMSDQHNANCLGAAGHPDARTPHLDALAAEGVRFTQAFCNNPVCGPSRASLLTGQYPHTHGITGNDIADLYAPADANVAQHFRIHGWQTALIGKAHLPRRWLESGFEYLRLSDLCDARSGDPLSCHYFAHLVKHGLGDRYDHGTLFPPHPGAGMRAFTSAIPFAHSLEKWTGDEALAFLESHRDPARPFFLKVSFQRPHDPYSPSPESVALYDAETLTLPDSAADFFDRRFEGKPRFQREYIGGEVEGYPYRPRDRADLRRQLAHHFALLTVIDEQIGRVVARLQETGEWENTLVCYLADHGDFAGEHGLALKNLGIYESVHRIPLLVRWPGGGPRGTTAGGIVESVDLFPTLCAAAGLPVPASVEGHDLRPVADGAAGGLGHTVCEWDFATAAQRTVFAVRTPEHRLVYYLADPDDGELYDRRTDPGELHNLYRDPAHRDVREQLTRLILNHVGKFRRRWSFQDDARVAAAAADGPAAPASRRLQKLGVKWTEIAPATTTVSEFPRTFPKPSTREAP